jgi:hypothetical protein
MENWKAKVFLAKLRPRFLLLPSPWQRRIRSGGVLPRKYNEMTRAKFSPPGPPPPEAHLGPSMKLFPFTES